MSRRSSRLHALERNVKAPRKPRAKARALTVMRLEGNSTAARSSAHGVRLPQEIEDQIAVVRGRTAGKPSRGLLQLEERLLRTPREERASPTIQRHDHGASPPVSTPVPANSPARAQSFALPEPMTGSAFSGRFNVESFEDASTPVPAIAPNLFAGVRLEVPPVPPINVGGAPVSGDGAPWLQPGANNPAGAVPWSAEQSRRATRQRALTADQQEVAASFERDIAALVGASAAPSTAPEDKQWDDTLRNVTVAAPAATAPSAVAPAPSVAPKPDAHDVFNQMGVAMNYANRFDLGAVDLSARFDQFDNELALTSKPVPPAPAPVPVQALALDDFDLVADLSELSGAQSTAPPGAAPPATAPTINPETAHAPDTATRGCDHDEPPR